MPAFMHNSSQHQ